MEMGDLIGRIRLVIAAVVPARIIVHRITDIRALDGMFRIAAVVRLIAWK